MLIISDPLELYLGWGFPQSFNFERTPFGMWWPRKILIFKEQMKTLTLTFVSSIKPCIIYSAVFTTKYWQCQLGFTKPPTTLGFFFLHLYSSFRLYFPSQSHDCMNCISWNVNKFDLCSWALFYFIFLIVLPPYRFQNQCNTSSW